MGAAMSQCGDGGPGCPWPVHNRRASLVFPIAFLQAAASLGMAGPASVDHAFIVYLP
jgi:hypothetical protein